MPNFYAQKDIRSNRTTNISTQDCWISGCGILERLPDAVGDEVYSDHPQDCSLDISKVRLCRHVYTYEVSFFVPWCGGPNTRVWSHAKYQGQGYDKICDKTY